MGHPCRALACVAMIVIGAGCRPGHRTAIGSRRVSAPGAAGLGIPYPVGDPERIEGWSRAALSRSSFAVVFTGEGETAYPRRVAGSASAMVGTIIRASEDDAAYDKLRAAAFGTKRPRPGDTASLSVEALEALGYAPAAPSVFLVGEDRNCRATVNNAVVGLYEADGNVLQIDWSLTGCVGEGWAPVALVSNRLPEDTRWVPAILGLDDSFDADEGWGGPLANALTSPVWTADESPSLEVVRILEIPGVIPTFVQVYDSLVRAAGDDLREELAARGLDPACADVHATSIAHGLWNGSHFDAFTPRAGDEPHVLGALVRAGQIDALVFDDRLDAVVVVPPAPTLEGQSDWSIQTVPSAAHGEFERQSWGYLPTSAPSPVGSPCAEPTNRD